MSLIVQYSFNKIFKIVYIIYFIFIFKCPPLAMVMATKRISGEEIEKVSQLEFPVIQLAADMNWDSGIVKHSLKDLEWTKGK